MENNIYGRFKFVYFPVSFYDIREYILYEQTCVMSCFVARVQAWLFYKNVYRTKNFLIYTDHLLSSE